MRTIYLDCYTNGNRLWYLNKIVETTPCEKKHKHDNRHREDGPALIITADPFDYLSAGFEKYYLNGKEYSKWNYGGDYLHDLKSFEKDLKKLKKSRNAKKIP